jgi:hypothetical protein
VEANHLGKSHRSVLFPSEAGVWIFSVLHNCVVLSLMKQLVRAGVNRVAFLIWTLKKELIIGVSEHILLIPQLLGGSLKET